MGLCCAGVSIHEGENHINKIFSPQYFRLATYDYNRLLNTIVKYRIDQEIHKKQVEENIIPEFFNKKDLSNPFLEQHAAFFNEILSKLGEKNNMYKVLLYFYPFINHTNEDVEDKLFETFNFIHRQIKQQNLIELFESYFKFVTSDLTMIIWSKENDSKMKNALDELRKIHSEKNVTECSNKILFPIIKELGSNEVVPIKMFRDAVKIYSIGDYRCMRMIVMNQFGEK